MPRKIAKTIPRLKGAKLSERKFLMAGEYVLLKNTTQNIPPLCGLTRIVSKCENWTPRVES